MTQWTVACQAPMSMGFSRQEYWSGLRFPSLGHPSDPGTEPISPALDQIRSVAQSCPTLCDPMNRSTPGLPVHHQLPEFTQTHVHRVSDANQSSHPLSSPSPPAPNDKPRQQIKKKTDTSLCQQVCLVKDMVSQVVMYGCDSWTTEKS